MAFLGQKSDEKTRKRIARLRARGWTFQAIGDKLGVTRQAVHQMLTGIDRGQYRPSELRCARCNKLIPRRGQYLRNIAVLCLQCMDRRPTKFGERLRTLRIAAGLSIRKLGALVGLSGSAIRAAEGELRTVRPRTIAKLIGVLGPRVMEP
jgi:transcriptional regulator with XRE-family HTH domain